MKTYKFFMAVEEVAKMIGLSEDDVRDLIECGDLPAMGSKRDKVRVCDLNKMLGIEIQENIINENSLDEKRGLALQFLPPVEKKKLKEVSKMLGVEFTTASVYYNNRKKCFQTSFYCKIEGHEKKRKTVSGKTESIVREREAELKRKILKEREEELKQMTANYQIADQSQGYKGGIDNYRRYSFDTPFPLVVANYMEFAKEKNSDRTYAGKVSMLNNHILTYFSNMTIGEIEEKHIQKFLNKLEYNKNGKQMSNKFIKNVYVLLKTILNYAYRKRYIEMVPTYGIEIPEGVLPKEENLFYTEEELIEILRATMNHPKYSFLTKLIIMSGMRREEFVALRWSNIDFEKRLIKVDKAMIRNLNKKIDRTSKWVYELGKTKTKSSVRDIPMGNIMIEDLKKWKQYLIDSGIMAKAIQNGTEDFVFLTEKGTVQKIDNLLKNYKGYIMRRCISDVNAKFHNFRRCYSTWARERGVDPMMIKKIMGHSLSNDITEAVYTKPTPKMYEEAALNMNQFMSELWEKANNKGALQLIRK